ncbi:LuxR C-terminal-related transcriptional regulator [Streptacidiphilus fuscans]|uniref:HTH luxR-type domain-containing protein n=1 Tax=Streptacidiphilus fuscans TaxID=2789292 RepID=A0A931FFF6_9ACTN|nr:LuxR C-terminal-related transcriptional regulator [Streptacidiphilus fuscans]MBF9072812.1 hypothetical protein [Streptacidiphilus fuscans]
MTSIRALGPEESFLVKLNPTVRKHPDPGTSPRPALAAHNGTDTAHALYDLAVKNPAWHPDDATTSHGWTQRELDHAADKLHRLGLFAPSDHTPSGWIALAPQHALGDLVQDFETQLAQFTTTLANTWENAYEVLTGYRTTYMTHHEDNRIHILDDPHHIKAALEKELSTTTSELLLQGTGDEFTRALTPTLHSLLDRGIQIRFVIRTATTHAPHAAQQLHHLLQNGAQGRSHPVLPLSFALIDHTTTLLHIPHDATTPQTPNPPPSRLLIAHSPVVNHILRTLFHHYWTHATPLTPQGTKSLKQHPPTTPPTDRTDPERQTDPGDPAPHQPPPPHDTHTTTLLHMLANGHTDQAISHHLGIHERTVRRKIAQLTTQLRANSRFQAGVNATKAGWLNNTTPTT